MGEGLVQTMSNVLGLRGTLVVVIVVVRVERF